MRGRAPQDRPGATSLLGRGTAGGGFLPVPVGSLNRRLPAIGLMVALTLLVLLGVAGCGGGARIYTTPEGFVGARVSESSLVMDAVYMDDPEQGIEGVVRLIWWDVFNVTVLNESDDAISLPVEQFSITDSRGQRHAALPLDSVLSYRSLVLGPLMGYQQRAIRRAFWRGEPIAPGTFAVGYVFFERHSNLMPCTFALDPNPEREEDELVAAFPPSTRRHEEETLQQEEGEQIRELAPELEQQPESSEEGAAADEEEARRRSMAARTSPRSRGGAHSARRELRWGNPSPLARDQ